MMDCRDVWNGLSVWYRGGLWVQIGLPSDIGEDRPTKGWACGVVGEARRMALDSHLAPYHGSMDEFGRSERQQGWVSLMGKVTHLCRVYQIVAVTSVFPEGTTERCGKGIPSDD